MAPHLMLVMTDADIQQQKSNVTTNPYHKQPRPPLQLCRRRTLRYKWVRSQQLQSG